MGMVELVRGTQPHNTRTESAHCLGCVFEPLKHIGIYLHAVHAVSQRDCHAVEA